MAKAVFGIVAAAGARLLGIAVSGFVGTQRPQLQAALDFLRVGDTLVVHSMDRLARNLDDLRRIVRGLTDKGVKVQFVKESLTFTGEDSPMANMLLSVLGAVAQFERELIKERQREGIAIAKAKTGKDKVYKGRKPALSADRAAKLRRRAADLTFRALRSIHRNFQSSLGPEGNSVLGEALRPMSGKMDGANER